MEALGGLAGADPADAEIYEHLGDAYRKNNRPGDARKAYEKGLKADPKRESLQQRLDALNTAEDER
ncbi:MAG: Tetratricopeptide repeat protein [candidate division BRC1 bacterium ADurb.BinA364]|nr:MAG: Tetratricopeptide repeat protein [candidate division BRC1 bacterium ADurb.BinA364]